MGSGLVVCVADDDEDAIAAVTAAVSDMSWRGVQIRVWSAESGAAVEAGMRENPDTDVIIMDVVMESPTAGLDALSAIRAAGNGTVRVLVHTGGPGVITDETLVSRHDISEWLPKGRTDAAALRAAVTTAKRTKDELDGLALQKEALGKCVEALAELASGGDRTSVMAKALSVMGGGAWFAFRTSHASKFRIVSGDSDTVPQEMKKLSKGFGELVAKALSNGKKAYFSNTACEVESCLLARPGGMDGHPAAEAALQVLRAAAASMAADEKAARAAQFDTQTQVLSRTGFFLEAARAQAVAGEACGIFMVDMAGFGRVNAALGHDAGDAILKGAARRISEFAGNLPVGRMASDSFAIFSPLSKYDPDAMDEIFQAPLEAGGVEVSMRVRVGAAGLAPGDTPQKAAVKAGMALDAAKVASKTGGNPVWFDAGFESEAKARLELSQGLFRELTGGGGGLSMVYQPQVSLVDGSVCGAEALIRWRTADGRFVPPDLFVPVAEQVGLVTRLTEFALSYACSTIRRGLDAGIPVPRVAVNVSAVEFEDDELVGRVLSAVAESGIPENMLEIEITETAAARNHDRLVATLTTLRAAGIETAIDDFGSGYSSLGRLRSLPVGKLKIDRVFVNALGSGSQNEGLAATMVALARTLGMRVMAEGVETREQADILAAMGADGAQGWLYAKGMPEDEFFRWISGRS